MKESEPPPRRSTVREPAPFVLGSEAVPEPSPVLRSQPVVISPTASDDAPRPQRSGWWSRRILGKD
jgi:hypothetical protein